MYPSKLIVMRKSINNYFLFCPHYLSLNLLNNGSIYSNNKRIILYPSNEFKSFYLKYYENLH